MRNRKSCSSIVTLSVAFTVFSLFGQITEKDLKGSPDAGLAKSYKFSSLPGAKSLKNIDYDAEMRTRPVINVSDPKFNEKKARAWHEKTAKLFIAAVGDSSEDFQSDAFAMLQELYSQPKSESSIKVFNAALDRCKALAANSASEKFVKKFLVQYITDMLVLNDGMIFLADFLKQIGMDEDAGVRNSSDIEKLELPRERLAALNAESKRKAVATLRLHATKISAIVFNPGIQNVDIIGRRMGWRLLKHVAGQIEKTQ